MESLLKLIAGLLGNVENLLDYFGYIFFAILTIWTIKKTNAKSKKAEKVLKKSIETKKTEAYALYPKIDFALCSGCTVCTNVCPEGDILQMVNGKPILVNPTKCVGHSLCQKSCPRDAITMVFGTKTNGKQVPDYDENYQTNVPGLYIAGELGGMGLIANAIRQGTIATEHAINNLKSAPGKTDIDVLVVGAGPAGLASTLKCIEKGVRYRCIEQNSFGGTVYNYPRQKLVMSHPATLPLAGKMSFPGARVTKEDLLAFWQKICKKHNVKVEEKVKFVGMESKSDHIAVETSKGEVKTKKVILACGVGGTPRKLGLPNEDLPKVTYSLIDPQQYKNKSVVVVGAGDSAVEAAQRVSDPKLKNKVHLLVRRDSLSRCKEDNKIKVEKMQKKGLLDIWYESNVKEIYEKHLIIDKKGSDEKVPNDFLILFMGTIPPFGFLEKQGVKIRTLYGQPLSHRDPPPKKVTSFPPKNKKPPQKPNERRRA